LFQELSCNSISMLHIVFSVSIHGGVGVVSIGNYIVWTSLLLDNGLSFLSCSVSILIILGGSVG
ncbi:9872_t:CDS:2, partial [Dentiscutata erythropus]